MQYRLAIAGNQWITQYLLEQIIESGWRPSLILNMPPERASSISGYVDLEPIARRHEIEVYRPASYSLKKSADRKALAERQIDALFVFGWQRLIPSWLIDRCGQGVYGVHGGPEKPPRCRGRAVFNWALLLGYEKFYLYLFQITPEVDAGPILGMSEFDITPHDDVLTLYHKNCIVSARMFLQYLPAILEGRASGQSQPEDGATYLPKRTPENGGIYWDKPAEEIANLIRAVAPPYPGAFTRLDDMQVRIHGAHVFDTKIHFQAEAGTVLDVFPNRDFLVMTADHPLYVRKYECDDPDRIVRGKGLAVRSGEQPPAPIV